jgi:hypothetical protein
MKTAILISTVILYLSLTIISCTKDESPILPIISTSTITDISETGAIGGGFISSDGGAAINARGLCWSTLAEPTISNSKTSDGDGDGQYVSAINGLTAGTIYHVRAYATNSIGTAYGADIMFSTLGETPSCITIPATEITDHAATLNGAIDPNSLETTVTFEYGISTSYGQLSTANESPISGNELVNVTANITGLYSGITYHFRVKTENSMGTCYGGDMVFTTPNSPQKSGLYTIKTGTDELYFIDLNDNSFTKVANIGLIIPNLFCGLQYIDNKIYISYSSKLYSYDLSTGILTQLISNSNLSWQFSINSLGELFTVYEITGTTPGSLYKINISTNISSLIGSTTGSPSIWGLGFDSSDKLWAVDELVQKFGTMSTNTGTFSASSSSMIYTDTYYSMPDNQGNLYSFNVGNPTGLVRYNISADAATLILPLSVNWAGLAYGLY